MEYNGYLLSGSTPVAQIQRGQVIPLDRSRMPLFLAAGGKFEDWLNSRAIDRHRPNSRILKKVLRLTDSSDSAAVLRAHAATITDNYWVRMDGEDSLSNENVLFTEDTFAEVALTGSFSSYSKVYEKAQLAAGSPKLTNNRELRKVLAYKRRQLVALQKRESFGAVFRAVHCAGDRLFFAACLREQADR